MQWTGNSNVHFAFEIGYLADASVYAWTRLIVEFIDAQSFDLRSVKKSCIDIVHPDGRLIPFETYNML